MIRSMLSKKRALAALSAVSVLAIAVAAFAYWTTSGSGSGSATAGTDAGVTVSGDPANGIYPGSSVAVTTTVTNSSATPDAVRQQSARDDLDRPGARRQRLSRQLVHLQGATARRRATRTRAPSL